MTLATESAPVRLPSVGPGVFVKVVVLPKFALTGRVAPDHRQAVRQDSSGFWVLWPGSVHLTCRRRRRKGEELSADALFHTHATSTQARGRLSPMLDSRWAPSHFRPCPPWVGSIAPSTELSLYCPCCLWRIFVWRTHFTHLSRKFCIQLEVA